MVPCNTTPPYSLLLREQYGTKLLQISSLKYIKFGVTVLIVVYLWVWVVRSVDQHYLSNYNCTIIFFHSSLLPSARQSCCLVYLWLRLTELRRRTCERL